MKLLILLIGIFVSNISYCQDYLVGDKIFFIKDIDGDYGVISNSKNKIWVIDSVFDIGGLPVQYGAKFKNGKDSFYCSLVTLNENIIAKKAISADIYLSCVKKYGKAVFYKLIDGKIWVGMTAAQALIAKGEPDDINTTVTRNIKHEQWVYGEDEVYLYLYFKNGVLTSFQY